jgi:hypothetical protein
MMKMLEKNDKILKKYTFFYLKRQLVPAGEDYTVWFGIPQDRGSALQTKIIFTTEYEIKCRLCNDIYLVLSAKVTGVLIGQTEAEVSEDVGEDQEHLTCRSVSFSNNRNLCSL